MRPKTAPPSYPDRVPYQDRVPVKERIGLSTLEDISHLILQSRGLDQTLQNIVSLVASRMNTEVCSIYLLEAAKLTLRATVGLSDGAVGSTHLEIGEGLVGHTAKSCTVVNVVEPQQDERFCYVRESEEEIFHSFLGIPLFDRQDLLGVLAIQTIEPREFSPIETSTLSTIGFQLASVVASTRLLDRLDSEAAVVNVEPQAVAENGQAVPFVNGEFGFGGVAIGPAHVVDDTLGVAEVCDEETTDPIAELERLNESFAAARIQTICLEKKIAERLDERDAAIFHSHLTILQDRVFIQKIQDLIHDGFGALTSVKQVVAEYVRTFSKMQDPYLRGRGADVEDVGRRLLTHLCDGDAHEHLQLRHPGIVVAEELMASDIAVLDLDKVLGIVLQKDDPNSHAVIVAKSLGIPTLVGAAGVLHHVEPSTPLVLDAQTKTLHIEPSKEIRSAYIKLRAEKDAEAVELQRFIGQPTKSQDGMSVTLRANIGLRSDVEVARRAGAEGVGLYRTELPYMARSEFPDRQTQYGIYRHVVEGFEGDSVTIRTLDIGGDKKLSYFETPHEDNPFLGWRSVRISLDQREVFRTQVEAILMAAQHGSVRIMFPMVTRMDEIIACKEIVQEARAALLAENIQVPHVPIGMMVETPATVLMAKQFARHVEFFSLGTNDLVQYLLAADRGNANIGHYYESLHPAVLHAIASVVEVAQSNEIGLSICGEMVSDPVAFAILVGLGLREFSVSTPSILPLKAFLAGSQVKDLERLAKRSLLCDGADQVTALATEAFGISSGSQTGATHSS